VRGIREILGPDPYAAFHAPRYAVVIREVASRVRTPDARILDIGTTSFTELLHQEFAVPVDSLGFAPDKQVVRGRHYHFDLNDTQWQDRWRTDLPQYDVVVFAEVMEHLHTSPRLVLSFVRTLLRPGGSLILQTPNAARLGARLKLLMGKHPYALISEDITEPDHFREYTGRELSGLLAESGFSVERLTYASYFDNRHAEHRAGRSRSKPSAVLLDELYRVLPPTLRTGMTAVAHPR